MDSKYLLALDIGGIPVTGGIVSDKGRVDMTKTIKSPENEKKSKIIKDVSTFDLIDYIAEDVFNGQIGYQVPFLLANHKHLALIGAAKYVFKEDM